MVENASANAALLPAGFEAIEASQDLIWARHSLLICYCSTLVRCDMHHRPIPKVQRSFPWPKGKIPQPFPQPGLDYLRHCLL
jgi:hypothetical protein